MPHELVIQGADGIKRVMTITCGGIKKSALVGPGIVIPGCCGSCGCKTEVPGCAAYGPPFLAVRWNVQGRLRFMGNVFGAVYELHKPVPNCCCGPVPQQRLRIYTKRLRLCPDGRTKSVLETTDEYDNSTGLWRQRIFSQARVLDNCANALGPAQNFEVFTPYQPGTFCADSGGQPSFFGREDPYAFAPTAQPFPPDVDHQGDIGIFSGGCNFWNFKSHTVNIASGVDEYLTVQAALVPHDGSCDGGPPCLQGCCFPDGTCQEGLSRFECTTRGGLFQPPGIGCFAARCLQPGERDRGRCCAPSGDCYITSPDACNPPNIFAGIGTTCAPLSGGNPCPQPLGACCLGAQCTQTNQLQCQEAGGAWQGPGTTCSPSPCIVGGACCKRDGTCQQVNSPQACVDLDGIFFPGGDCQTVTCPECCYVDEPERTYTLSSGGETVVLGPVTHCCWERAQYAINGGGVYRLRLNFNPPNCYAQEIYFSFEQQLGGQWQLVKRILNYGQGTGSCGNPAEESFDRINIDRCTSADAVLNLMVGSFASGGTGMRQTTCSSGTAERTDANSGSTATLSVNVNITGGTACLEGCGTDGRLGPGDVRVIGRVNPLVVPDGRGGWERVDGGGRGCSGCGGGGGF